MQVELDGRVALVAGGPDGRAASLAAQLEANGAQVARCGQITTAEAAEGAVGDVIRRFGRLDILIHAEAADGDAAGLAGAAAARMAGQGGRIVHVASAEGLVPARGRAAQAAASAGVFALTRAMALDLAGHGVLVNAIAAPGLDAERGASHIPLGRTARAAEVANAALFLVAPASSYVTGHVLTVDGGWSAGFARDF